MVPALADRRFLPFPSGHGRGVAPTRMIGPRTPGRGKTTLAEILKKIVIFDKYASHRWQKFIKNDEKNVFGALPASTNFSKVEIPIFLSKTLDFRRVPPSDFGKSVPEMSMFLKEFIR